MACSVVAPMAAVAAVAALAGWLGGGLLAGPMQLRIAQVLGSGGPSFPVRSLLVALLVVEAITVLATLVTAWRTARLGTTAALSAAPPRLVAARASRLVARLRLGPVADVAARDVATRPARAGFTVTSMVLGVMAVVVTVGFSRTVDRALADPRLTGDPYELAVSVDDPSSATTASVARVLSAEQGVTSFHTATERRVVDDQGAFLGRALGGDVAHAGYVIRKGRLFGAPDEAIAGYGLLRSLGITVGDRVTVHVHGRPLTFRIVGQYSESEDGGEVLQFPLVALQRVEPGAQPESFLVHGNRADVDSIAASLVPRVRGVAQVRLSRSDGSDELRAFRLAFTLVTVVVLAVALVNLGATLVLAVRERERALGVLRAVGFTGGETVAMAATSAAILAVAGVALGLPFGWAAYHALMASVGDSSGIGPGLAAPLGAMVVAVVAPAIVITAVGIGALAARRVAFVPVADLVRSQ